MESLCVCVTSASDSSNPCLSFCGEDRQQRDPRWPVCRGLPLLRREVARDIRRNEEHAILKRSVCLVVSRRKFSAPEHCGSGPRLLTRTPLTPLLLAFTPRTPRPQSPSGHHPPVFLYCVPFESIGDGRPHFRPEAAVCWQADFLSVCLPALRTTRCSTRIAHVTAVFEYRVSGIHDVIVIAAARRPQVDLQARPHPAIDSDTVSYTSA